jgi:hypothetical protein
VNLEEFLQAKEGVLYLSMVVLSFDNKMYIPELIPMMGEESFLKLVDACPLQIVKIPSISELEMVAEIILYYRNVVRGREDANVYCERNKINGNKHRSIRNNVEKLKKYIRKHRVPEGLFSGEVRDGSKSSGKSSTSR